MPHRLPDYQKKKTRMLTFPHLPNTPIALRHPSGLGHAAKSVAASSPGAAGFGGSSVASIVARHVPSLAIPLGIIVEHLSPQIGTWQVSIDEGASWHTIRTDLINRPGNTGLALEGTARLRVLPLTASARHPARMVLHAAQRAPGQSNGCYQNYPPDDRCEAARSITLVLSLDAINGRPPAVPTTRPRNKRATAAQRSSV